MPNVLRHLLGLRQNGHVDDVERKDATLQLHHWNNVLDDGLHVNGIGCHFDDCYELHARNDEGT